MLGGPRTPGEEVRSSLETPSRGGVAGSRGPVSTLGGRASGGGLQNQGAEKNKLDPRTGLEGERGRCSSVQMKWEAGEDRDTEGGF